MHITLIDPAQQVPYYDRELANALLACGARLTVMTAPLPYYEPFPFAPQVEVRLAFGRVLCGRLGPWLVAHRAIRRLARGVSYPLELARCERDWQRERPDVLHWQWTLWPALETRLVRRWRSSGGSTVLTVHNIRPHEDVPGLGLRSLGRLYRSYDRLLVHSEATKRRLLATFPELAEAAVEVVPMAPPSVVERWSAEEARRRLGLPVDRPLVLFFGHIRPYKGVDTLLAAASLLRQRLPQCLVLIAGPATGGGSLLATLRQRVATLRLADTVWLRPGFVPHELVAAHFGAADVLALPYRETDDSAVLAWSRGFHLPVVATSVGGLAEALAAGGGLLVPPDDPQALAEALGRVLSDSALRERLSAQAAQVAAGYTWRDVARRHLEIYASLRAAPRAKAIASQGLAGETEADKVVAADRVTGSRRPFVSVVMAVRNEAATIGEALDALLAGTYPPDRMEVLVVDGLSEDGTSSLVAERAHRDPRVKLLTNPKRSTASGLNVGIAAARGEVIVRLDGHTVPAPDYVAAAVAALERESAWCVGGHFVGRGQGLFGQAVALAVGSPFGAGDAAFRLGGRGPTDTVYLGAWPRRVLLELGGFDEGLVRNQDYELCVRIRQAGGTVWLEPAMRTSTWVRSSPIALAKQYFGYGAGRIATVLRHPRSLRWRQVIPALFVLLILLGLALAPRIPVARSGLAITWLGYAWANVTSSLVLARRNGWRYLIVLPFVFAILHLAWGLGFWLGLPQALRQRLTPMARGAYS